MKIAAYGSDSRLGLVSNGHIIDLHSACAYLLGNDGESRPYAYSDALIGTNLAEFLSGGKRALEAAKRVASYFERNPSDEWKGLRGEGIVSKLSSSLLRPPLTNTNPKIMCAGGNLADHAVAIAALQGEGNVTVEGILKKKQNEPVSGFYKQASSIVGNMDVVPYPRRTQRLDYEGEIALVIGRRGENIPASKYLDYTFGFAIFDDFSIRDDLIGEGSRGGFNLRKNFQACGSLGPWITTKDEIINLDFDIMTKVNGIIRQNGNTRLMIKKFGEIVERLSSDIVLNPGDIITSGTCSGTAMDSSPRDKSGSQDPNLFLHVGDVVEVSSRQLGSLTNMIVAKTDQNFEN
jgi:2-keto-4-pentenoate hydratase/2-oxohepta-3-ene-1,7-dioic acid hydratase in catechol pathway